AAQPAGGLPIARRQVQDVVAVQQASGRVHDETAVGVAVERQTEVRLARADFLRERLRVQGPAPLVDVAAVGPIVYRRDPGAGAPVQLGRERAGCAVGAVEDDREAPQGRARTDRLQ